MIRADRQTAARIDTMRRELAAEITERHFARRPELQARFGDKGRLRCREDAEFHLRYLAQALALGVPQLFEEYISWAASMLESRGVPRDDLRADLLELGSTLAERLDRASDAVDGILQAAIRRLAAAPTNSVASLGAEAQRYFEAALRDPVEAGHVVDSLLNSGMPVGRILMEVLQPAMYEVGQRWQANTLSTADEHYFTAVTQRVVGRIYSELSKGRPRGPMVVVSCVSGELHELGARMVCDLLSLNGYRTHYLGASMPPAAIVDYACMHGASALALSASITPHLGELAQAIERVRAEPRCAQLKILVGGGVFNLVPELWRAVGADAWAPDAASAVSEMARLLQ